MEKSARQPADFIESLPADVRVDVDRLDAAITNVMSGHAKTMWDGKFWGGSNLGHSRMSTSMGHRGDPDG